MYKHDFIKTAIENLLEINKVLQKHTTYKIEPLIFKGESNTESKIDFAFLKSNTISKSTKTLSFVEHIETKIDDETTFTDSYKYMIFIFADRIDLAFSKLIVNSDGKIVFSNIVKVWKLPLTFKFDAEFVKLTYDKNQDIEAWKIHILNTLNKISTTTFELHE